MNLRFTLLILLFSVPLLGACTSGIGGPDTFGLIYSDVVHSESRDVAIGLRQGTSCQASYLGLFAVGDNSIPTAARYGAIREVHNVSFRYQSLLLFLWRTNCTVVYGK